MANLLRTLRDSYDIEGRVLQKLGLRTSPVYLRKVSYAKSDDNLGVRGVETYIDTPIVPNPVVKAVSLAYTNEKNGYLQLGDLEMVISGNVARGDIEGADFIVYDDKLWKVVRVSADPDESMPLQWKVIVRKHIQND